MRRSRWPMLVLAFVNKNVAVGATFGVYGLLIDRLVTDFHSSRAVISFGIALVSLMMGVCSPVVGRLLDRWSTRATVVAGHAIAGAGFIGASQASSTTVFLFCFGIVVGIGMTTMGVLPAVKLATGWFADAPGRAVGFVMLPISLAATPPLVGWALAGVGWRALLLGLSGLFFALIPFSLLIRDPPSPQPHAGQASSSAAVTAIDIALLRDLRFWQIVITAGFLVSSTIVLATHIAPYGTGLGLPVSKAALLLSAVGFAAIVGAPLFGWLADRFTPPTAIAVNALGQVVFWLLLLRAHQFAALFAIVALFGIFTSGAYPSITALITRIYGAARVGTVVGYMSLMVVPFNFGMPPLVGWMFDLHGDYSLAFTIEAACCFAVVLLMLGVGRFLAPAPA